MDNIRFVWDMPKAAANKRKHRVSFEEARSVFLDEHARQIPDVEHSGGEDRFVLLGLSERLRVLVVVHAFRESELVIRLISARRATKAEQEQYWEQR